jgi:anhydro-N-acetylmuramic acid kinase
MVYKAIGIMSGSSLDGLDIAYTQFQETGGKWDFEILHAECLPYSTAWAGRLSTATSLSALDYQLLHADFGHYIGEQVNLFIDRFDLHHKVHLVSSHGHTTFHVPTRKMTAQLGDGAAIAAVTGLPVVSDLRAMDVAFGGQGAPIVPIGEKLLLNDYDLLLNLGGIANISARNHGDYIAFDVCPANRIMNMIAGRQGLEYDENGALAAKGTASFELLQRLDQLEYYGLPYPKSLANDFGTGTVLPLIDQYGLSMEDALRTCVEHICAQLSRSVTSLNTIQVMEGTETSPRKMLVTGGGAQNEFLISRLKEVLGGMQVEIVVPGRNLVNYKEAMIMGLIGILRWREEYNVLSSVTGAARSSIGGALWMGAEA